MAWIISKEGLNDAIGSVLSSLRGYDQKPHWKCVCERCFTEEELKHIEKAELVQGDYGLSVCLTMTGGVVKYITTDTRPKDSMDGKYYLKPYGIGDTIEPSDIVLRALKNVAKEACEKLNKVRPATLAQASRISGVNPSDVEMILVYLESRKR